MAIIKKKIGNATYLYEKKSYRDKETGKVKTKWTCLGKLDENGDLIPSKKKSAQSDEGRTGRAGTQDNHDEVYHQAQTGKRKIIIPEIVETTTEEKNQQVSLPAEISTKKPKAYISPNTKVSNKLFCRDNAMLYGREIKIAVEGNKSKKQINTLLSVNYDALSQYKVAFRQLIPFDRTVHDAIVSHYIGGGNEFITTDMIYRVLAGDDGTSSHKHAMPELATAILDSVKRMASTLVSIDAGEQARAYKKGMEAKYTGNLLYMEMVEVSLNGQKTGCIHVLRKPVLYQYANDFDQVTQTDLNILNIPELINSPENVILKTYLLQQIRIMQYNAAYSRTIRYDTLYELLNIQAESEGALRKKKLKIREHVKKCLEYWKSQNFIQGYTEEKEQKAIAKVTLQVKTVKSSTRSLPAKIGK